MSDHGRLAADGWSCTRVGKVTYRRPGPHPFRWSDLRRISLRMSYPENGTDFQHALSVLFAVTFQLLEALARSSPLVLAQIVEAELLRVIQYHVQLFKALANVTKRYGPAELAVVVTDFIMRRD